MEPQGLLSLPVELLHILCRYLPVEDVLSCTLTCHHMRDSLNENSVWKRFLPERDITGLESQEQLVQPIVNIDSSLTALCDNWRHYARKTRLVNNWREEHFVQNKIDEYRRVCSYTSGLFNRTKGKGELIYKNKYLFLGRFINDVQSDAIEVWNIEKAPVLHTSIDVKQLDYEGFHLIGDYLVIIECSIVNVYDIVLPGKEFPLKFSFLVTDSAMTLLNPSSHPGRCDMRCVGWYHTSAGQYLVSSKCDESTSKCMFHVWDICNATKVGEFFSPVDGWQIGIVSSVKNEWIMKQNSRSSDEMFYTKFNIEKREFTESIFKYLGHEHYVVVSGSLVLTFSNVDKCNQDACDSECILYDFQTSQTLKKRLFHKVRDLRSVVIVNGMFAIITENSVQAVNVLNLETVYNFPSEDVVGIKFLLSVCGSFFVVTHNRRYFLETWDVKKQRRLSKLNKGNNSTHIYVNDTCSVLVCIDRSLLSVFHFW